MSQKFIRQYKTYIELNDTDPSLTWLNKIGPYENKILEIIVYNKNGPEFDTPKSLMYL